MNKIKSQKIDEREPLSYEVGSIGRIQAWLLAEKAAILEFFLGEYQSFSFFIHRDGFKIRALPPRKDIENSLRAYLKILSTPPQRGFQGHKAARRLYQDFLFPFEKELSSVDHLIVIPDGILNYLPFETLIQGCEGNRSRPKYLIESMKISYAPSASFMDFLFRQPAEKTNSKMLLALGDPLYSVGKKKNMDNSAGDALREVYLENGFDFSPLPHSKEEVLAISRRFQKDSVDVFLRERAKEEIVKKSEIRNYQILHFACHSFLDEKFPFRSALVLTLDDDEDEDGFLQGREIYGLELKADLVVLSACQTGKGKLEDAEGVLGLPRIFFNSGAKAVVSSLWKVNDKSTSDLMRQFYFHLSTGKDKAHALRLAKLTMLSSKYAHPFYWAGFILNGDYRTLPGF